MNGSPESLMNELERSRFATKRVIMPAKEKEPSNDDSENSANKRINGGADGTRTRDLQRDRLAF